MSLKLQLHYFSYFVYLAEKEIIDTLTLAPWYSYSYICTVTVHFLVKLLHVQLCCYSYIYVVKVTVTLFNLICLPG